jgi:CubicO group peptidase (beta-lactamase class C family)
LKVAYAITYAEPGYPPIELQHRLRIGSVSKFLTAMAAVRLFGPRGDAGTFFSSLAGELEIPATAHNLPYLNLIRVEELLRHRTGWGSSETASFGEGEIQAAVGHAPPKPGDLRTFFALTHHDIMAPGALMYYTAEYNNWNFAVLGEVVSKAITPGYGHYETAMWQFWGQMTGHIIRHSWSASRALNEPPCHLRLPGIWWNPEGTDPPYVPYQYASAQPYAAAAGQWVISMVEMCRIASRLNPQAESPLLNAAELAALTEPYELPHQPGDDPSTYQVLPPPGGQGGGRGCYFFESTMRWGGGPPQPVWVLNHNGAVAGGCALLIHVIPKSGGGDPSVSIAIALNHDAGLGWQEIVDLVTIAQKAEEDDTWPDGDLFDHV